MRMQPRRFAAAGAVSCALLLLPHQRAWAQAAADAPITPSTTAPEPPPAPSSDWLAHWTDPAHAPFIPIPEIDTDPQTGLTLGVIAVVLRIDAQGEIARILAPDVFKSQYFGWGARMRIFDYPSEDTQWSVVGGGKQRVEREFDALYVTGLSRHEPLSWSVETIYDRSGTPRFFGIGNDSLFTNEATYVNNQGAVSAMVGRNLTPALQLAYVARLRAVDVLPGVLPGIPSIETLYPGLKGIGSEHALENTVMLTADTRDSTVMPQSGARYIVYAGVANSALASSVSYSYVGAAAYCYWPLARDTTLAWHAAMRYMPSAADAPFWASRALAAIAAWSASASRCARTATTATWTATCLPPARSCARASPASTPLARA